MWWLEKKEVYDVMSRKMSKDRKEKWLRLAVGAALMVGVSGVVPGMASAEEVTLQGGEGEFYSSVGEKFSIAHEGWDEKWYSVFADDASTGNTITVTNFTAPGYDLRIAGGYAAGGAVTGNKISTANSTLESSNMADKRWSAVDSCETSSRFLTHKASKPSGILLSKP